MALEDYRKKRNFSTTPEPRGEVENQNLHRFVIQRHQARRLHYDLRLEINGVLKSWAVPKGPSMNPSDKRLAIQTEDHPLKYLTFKGTIPKGNYGAGEMSIWDEGTFEIIGSEKNTAEKKGSIRDLKLQFFGKKIKGTFALVKTKRKNENNQWLLIKKKDQFSTDLEYDAEVFVTRQTLPESQSPQTLDPQHFVKPMLATATPKIFNKSDWIYELKWDGYRVLTNIEGGRVNLYSRNGISYNHKFPELVRDLEQISHEVVLDGEIVVVDEKGIPQFQQLQNYDEQNSGTLRYYVFDMLYLNGHNMLALGLMDRKSLLPEVLENLEHTFFCDHIEGMGSALYKRALESGMEGVMAKQKNSPYIPGFRTEQWLKIKEEQSQEAIICGYTESESTVFGSLILGVYQDKKLIYIGNCGSGFSNGIRQQLLQLLRPLTVPENPFEKKIKLKGRTPHWVIPSLICEIKFSEWTSNNRMRHPVFKRIRKDKTIAEIEPEVPVKKNTTSNSSPAPNTLDIEGNSVAVSNLEKVLWPDTGFRKYDLINYYLEVSNYILPYLKDRPESLHRHPDGISKKGFYQKEHEHLPTWAKSITLYSASSKRNIDYLLCQNQATLLYMANLGCIELNPWNSTVQQLEAPSYGVIDLDPSPKNTFEEVIEVAQAVKTLLEELKLKGVCKTSGSRGLHIYLPMGGNYTYEEVRSFIKLLCFYIEEKTRGLTTMERKISKRGNKIYLDYLQNRRGQTLAAPYCVRPKKGAPVSTPLAWKEVKSGLKLLDFTMESVPARLMKLKKDLFKPVLGKGPAMEKTLEKLKGF